MGEIRRVGGGGGPASLTSTKGGSSGFGGPGKAGGLGYREDMRGFGEDMGGSGGPRAVRASLSAPARGVSVALPSHPEHPWGSPATTQGY